MNAGLIDQIASAILYEGYILYPYRPSALKNQQRFNFGVVAPSSLSASETGACELQTECLVRAAGTATLDVRVRFLHLTTRRSNGGDWEEAIERVIAVDAGLVELCKDSVRRRVTWADQAHDGRTQQAVTAEIEISASRIEADGDLYRVTARIGNATELPDAASRSRSELLKQSLVSTHAILHVAGGAFESLLDIPPEIAHASASCRNLGLWPVLAGETGARDAMLASPIILYDYPQVAPESNTDFFDGTEIDEMLVLRILTLTDHEKEEMRHGDARARRLLEQTESLSDEHLYRLHGALRSPHRFEEEPMP